MEYHVIKYNTMSGGGIAFVEAIVPEESALNYVLLLVKHAWKVDETTYLGKVNGDNLDLSSLEKVVGSDYNKKEHTLYEFWRTQSKTKADEHLNNYVKSMDCPNIYFYGGDCW